MFWSPREPTSRPDACVRGFLPKQGERFGKGPCIGECGQLWDLELQPRLGDSPERCGLPVGLLRLLPHDHVETAAVLVAEEEACVVVIGHCVHVEGAFKVHTIEGCISWRGGGQGQRRQSHRWSIVQRSTGGVGRMPAGCVWPACPPPSAPVRVLCLEIIELGVPYIPTARPGSLFMV